MYDDDMMYINPDKTRIIINNNVLEVDDHLWAVFIDGSQIRWNGNVLSPSDAEIISEVADLTDIGIPPIAVFTTRSLVEYLSNVTIEK
jgi:delta-aminolevulinic acid dehydratase/porphobilinogen synthase